MVGMLTVGEAIEYRGFRKGTIKKVDSKNERFFYLCDFRGKGGNGSLVWLPRLETEYQNYSF